MLLLFHLLTTRRHGPVDPQTGHQLTAKLMTLCRSLLCLRKST